jgi:hypothetical protein
MRERYCGFAKLSIVIFDRHVKYQFASPGPAARVISLSEATVGVFRVLYYVPPSSREENCFVFIDGALVISRMTLRRVSAQSGRGRLGWRLSAGR